VPRLSNQARWWMQLGRHLAIQGAAFVALMVIAVICAFNGSWPEAGVFALLAMFPGMMLLALIHKMRTVARRTASTKLLD
jgi:hypothetical protein